MILIRARRNRKTLKAHPHRCATCRQRWNRPVMLAEAGIEDCLRCFKQAIYCLPSWDSSYREELPLPRDYQARKEQAFLKLAHSLFTGFAHASEVRLTLGGGLFLEGKFYPLDDIYAWLNRQNLYMRGQLGYVRLRQTPFLDGEPEASAPAAFRIDPLANLGGIDITPLTDSLINAMAAVHQRELSLEKMTVRPRSFVLEIGVNDWMEP